MAVDHDAARHLERGACCDAQISQPHRQALEYGSKDRGIPPRDKGYGFDFGKVFGMDLTAYSNAHYADKSNDRRSVWGTVITLGGAAVGWASSPQRCVTLSTARNRVRGPR